MSAIAAAIPMTPLRLESRCLKRFRRVQSLQVNNLAESLLSLAGKESSIWWHAMQNKWTSILISLGLASTHE